jgi:hypothetical protein
MVDILGRMISDTDAKTQELWIELHRQMTPGQRINRALEMTELVRSLFAANLRREHPGISENEVRRRMVRAYYGEEWAEKLHGRTASA